MHAACGTNELDEVPGVGWLHENEVQLITTFNIEDKAVPDIGVELGSSVCGYWCDLLNSDPVAFAAADISSDSAADAAPDGSLRCDFWTRNQEVNTCFLMNIGATNEDTIALTDNQDNASIFFSQCCGERCIAEGAFEEAVAEENAPPAAHNKISELLPPAPAHCPTLPHAQH